MRNHGHSHCLSAIIFVNEVLTSCTFSYLFHQALAEKAVIAAEKLAKLKALRVLKAKRDLVEA
jgi:hypothetical protein